MERRISCAKGGHAAAAKTTPEEKRERGLRGHLARYHPEEYAELKRHEAARSVLTESADAARVIVEAVLKDEWYAFSPHAEAALRVCLKLGVIPYVLPPDDRLYVYYKHKLIPALEKALFEEQKEIVGALTRQMELQRDPALILKRDRFSTQTTVRTTQ